jgi:acetyltransferase-like isoleucine patch superfamily enzyme
VNTSTVYSDDELRALGLASIGSDVRIDRRAAIFGAPAIEIGSHVRIDCFAVITAGPARVRIGSYTHVAAHTYLSGAQGGIDMGYGSGIAPFAAVYSAVEDYTRGHLTNPSVPEDLREALVAPVVLGAHAALGSSSVVLAGVTLGFGCSVGALTLVSRRVRPFEVVHGNPARRVQIRDRERLLALDETLREQAAREGLELFDPTDWRATG